MRNRKGTFPHNDLFLASGRDVLVHLSRQMAFVNSLPPTLAQTVKTKGRVGTKAFRFGLATREVEAIRLKEVLFPDVGRVVDAAAARGNGEWLRGGRIQNSRPRLIYKEGGN